MVDLRTRLSTAAPVLVVALVVAAGFVRVLMSNWREGAVIMAMGLLLAAALRLVLPSERVGVLAVRSKFVDVLCYGVPAIGMVVLAITIVRGHITLS